MLVELNYVVFSFLLATISAWRYFKRREKNMLHLTLCFTFLTLSITLLLLDSLMWFPATITTLRLIEVTGLGLYACFTICAILTLRKICETKLD